MGRRRAAVVVSITLLLGACSGGDDGSADPTVPTAASTSSTTAAAIDISKVPERIDEPYLNAVLAALDKIDGDATRIIQETKRFPPEAADLLNAIYGDEEFQGQSDVWLMTIGEDPQLSNIRPSPGDRKTVVERIIAASPRCVWLAVRRDHSAVNVDPGPARTEYVALQPLDRSNDPKGVNRTAWMITADHFRPDGSEPANPCPTA